MYKSVLIVAAIASASAFVPAPRPAVSRTAVFAEDVDYEAQFTKMQKEAEERLDDKVEELMKNIETVGQN
ncbi:hypothetical protein THAOC_01189 [Thalassiosira oceanica]|uniref:RxLR effector protein n=1 Tax=Thalassiosira oceanica TaxID=159749 RepID=K0TIU3_THAOC|nr:hypothetical protein THAOC_01189 [Thalassiosira oceanica]|eukprot:EJK77009.1 hypothetical protein THAOC_01189 [Thalassiosira oceanica]